MIIRFGEFEIDDEQGVLRRDGELVPIQPKPFDVLLYLARARDRVVHKTELLERLWPDAIVGEHSVVRAVNLARVALGESAGASRFIRCHSRRGYRFVAPVEERRTSASAGSPARPAPARAPDATGPSGDVFVGRDALVAALAAELARAFAGEARVLLLEGEAGIGKTRTAEEAARVARANGAQVVTGWCPENEATVPFRPWRQILRALAQTELWTRIRRAQPSACAELAWLSRAQRAEAASARDVAPDEARFRLFDAVATVLRAAAEETPLLVVIDDLHAADASTLRLVETLARELADARIALLLTLRSEEVSGRHPVVATLAEVARRGRTVRFALSGLAREDVAHCISAWTARPPDRPFLDEVFERSEGNPFFVRELALWLSSTTPGAGIPPNVRDVIRRRLLPRTPECVALLSHAAVIGREFDFDLLRAASGASEDAVLAGLEEALATRLVCEAPGAPGRWRFAHTLIQETLLAEQSHARRARAHRGIAAALATLDDRSERRLAERAYHACEGADAATAQEAADCALRAAERALRITAFEEAARLYRRALDALALDPAAPQSQRCDVLLDLGRALAHAGDATGSEDAFARAAELASAERDVPRTVRAAMGLLGNLPALAPPSEDRIRLLEEAVAQLGTEDAGLRAVALSRLGLAWSAAGRPSRAIASADAALAAARTLGNRRGLAGALSLRTTVSLPSEEPGVRLARVDEALRVLAGTNAPRVELECRIQRAAALLELGDAEARLAESAAYARVAETLGHPTPRWYAAVQSALDHALAGDLAAAERAALAAWAAGRRCGHPDASTYLAIQLTQLRWFQGRLAEVEEPLRRALGRGASLVGLRAALALVLAETGRSKESRRELDALAADACAILPRDAGWLSNVSLLALTAANLRHAGHAATLHALLSPYRGRHVCAFVVTSNGDASYFVGRLARVLGRADEAVTELQLACASNRRGRVAPWAALAEAALAEALLARGRPGDAVRARELAGGALAAAERIGMSPLVAEARRLDRAAAATTAGGRERARPALPPRADPPGVSNR